MRIEPWLTNSGKNVIKEYIKQLSVDERIDAYSVLDVMGKGQFDQINCKRWAGKVWEVRFRKNNRIFFVVVKNETVYLLHACRKQKNKTEKTDKSIVEKRAKQLGKRLQMEFI